VFVTFLTATFIVAASTWAVIGVGEVNLKVQREEFEVGYLYSLLAASIQIGHSIGIPSLALKVWQELGNLSLRYHPI